MRNPINTLHLIHNLRHNMVMLTLCNSPIVANTDEFKKLISVEMMMFCAGSEHLGAEDYSTYVEWFMANTPPEILNLLKPIFTEVEQHLDGAAPINDAEDIPF